MKAFKRLLLFVTIVLLTSTLFADPGWQSLGDVLSARQSGSQVEITAQRGKVRLDALAPGVIRVTYAPAGKFSDIKSFAVLPDAFTKINNLQLKDAAAAIELRTGEVLVRIAKKPLRIAFLDASGKVLSDERPEYPASFDGSAFRVWKSMPQDEHYYGLGDKTGPLDHRDLAFTMWNTDAFGWQESTDPLYKSIPFVLSVRPGVAYGIFLDNTYRSSFDFGKESRDMYSFGSDGGPVDYYFFYGSSPKKVLQLYTQLVGRTPLAPLFALGFQQCRYSYYPESQVREVTSEFRKRSIPADVIYLDIDYQQNNRPFTIDNERFPNFAGLVKDLSEQGFKLVTITDLHLAKLPGYKPYDEGIAKGYFVKNPDGSTFVGPVWPGDSVFPDFTRKEVRDWWGTLYTDFVKLGVRGFWNDMNEPSVFNTPVKTMPLDVVHNVEGRLTDHREIHNVFGMENVHATYDGMLKLRPNERPFVLTRAGFAGAERYAATWTGDNTATFDHMRISIPQLINLGLSGYAFVGADIGGFNGSATPELLTRWMELGAFNPIYRNHAAKETRFREPWVDGPVHEAIRKRYIETRYRLLPYIYTAMEQNSRDGVPLMRPMFMEFPDDPALLTNGEEYMFGDDLLVAPRVWNFVGNYNIVLPKGDWFDYWTGTRIAGDRTIAVDPPMETLPVYVRGGSIIPQQPVIQYVGQIPNGPLELHVYPGPNCAGDLYADDGNTFNYQRGESRRYHFSCTATGNSVEVTADAPKGTYQPWFHQYAVTIHGVTGKASVIIDGQATADLQQTDNSLTLPGVSASGAHTIRVTF